MGYTYIRANWRRIRENPFITRPCARAMNYSISAVYNARWTRAKDNCPWPCNRVNSVSIVFCNHGSRDATHRNICIRAGTSFINSRHVTNDRTDNYNDSCIHEWCRWSPPFPEVTPTEHEFLLPSFVISSTTAIPVLYTRNINKNVIHE